MAESMSRRVLFWQSDDPGRNSPWFPQLETYRAGLDKGQNQLLSAGVEMKKVVGAVRVRSCSPRADDGWLNGSRLFLTPSLFLSLFASLYVS